MSSSYAAPTPTKLGLNTNGERSESTYLPFSWLDVSQKIDRNFLVAFFGELLFTSVSEQRNNNF